MGRNGSIGGYITVVYREGSIGREKGMGREGRIGGYITVVYREGSRQRDGNGRKGIVDGEGSGRRWEWAKRYSGRRGE